MRIALHAFSSASIRACIGYYVYVWLIIKGGGNLAVVLYWFRGMVKYFCFCD